MSPASDDDAPGPRVSVIVPVRDRRELVIRLLDGLAAQTVDDYEVLVVDDGSTDGTDAEAAARAAVDHRVRVLRNSGRGAVDARCQGVAAARAPVLAFTDSDCEPVPDWLERGLAAVEAGADVVQGRTEPTGLVRPLERTVWVRQEDGLYATCNVFYRRSAFDAAGGFDQAAGRRIGFRPGAHLRDLGFGEDTLLGWRVRRAGRSAFVPEALVRHHVFPPDARGHLRRACNAGGFAVLVRDVPELREVFLTRRFLLGGPARLPLYAASLLLLVRRPRVAAASLLWWAGGHAARLRHAPGSWRRKAASLPVVLAGDAVTAATLLAGSARSRALVL